LSVNRTLSAGSVLQSRWREMCVVSTWQLSANSRTELLHWLSRIHPDRHQRRQLQLSVQR